MFLKVVGHAIIGPIHHFIFNFFIFIYMLEAVTTTIWPWFCVLKTWPPCLGVVPLSLFWFCLPVQRTKATSDCSRDDVFILCFFFFSPSLSNTRATCLDLLPWHRYWLVDWTMNRLQWKAERSALWYQFDTNPKRIWIESFAKCQSTKKMSVSQRLSRREMNLKAKT